MTFIILYICPLCISPFQRLLLADRCAKTYIELKKDNPIIGMTALNGLALSFLNLKSNIQLK